MAKHQSTEADFVQCTTKSRKLRHWSETPSHQWGLYPLCGSSPWAEDAMTANMSHRGRGPVVVADLPPCKQCDKAKARRIAGRPS